MAIAAITIKAPVTAVSTQGISTKHARIFAVILTVVATLTIVSAAAGDGFAFTVGALTIGTAVVIRIVRAIAKSGE